MKILVIASEIPYPLTDSNRACYYHLLRRLRGKHDVTVLAMSSGGTAEDAARVADFVDEIIVVQHEIRKTFPRRLASLFSTLPFGVLLFRSATYARALRDLLARKNFDVIVAGNVNMAQFTVDLEGTPKIIFPQDAWSLYYRRLMKHARNPAAFLYSLLQHLKLKRYERRTYGRYDACVMVARRDADIIREACPDLPIYFAHSGVDMPPLEDVAKEANAIVFSGVMDYPPNRDCVLYFANEVFPLIRKDVPAATFRVVGKNPGPEILALADRPGVVVTGTVPDLIEYIRRMEIYVCPMRLGSGMKMKIVEALSAALPVVSTSVGADGMDQLVAGRDFVVADGPAPFAAAVVELLRDPDARRRFGRAGRAEVEKAYTWEAYGRAWDEIIEAVSTGE
ncbi:MAG: glycosyltransferase [candidate division Zixibacteria bacterium]|nr:glycosyltransferase [candidate division Zixibacteria bacterium]